MSVATTTDNKNVNNGTLWKSVKSRTNLTMQRIWRSWSVQNKANSMVSNLSNGFHLDLSTWARCFWAGGVAAEIWQESPGVIWGQGDNSPPEGDSGCGVTGLIFLSGVHSTSRVCSGKGELHELVSLWIIASLLDVEHSSFWRLNCNPADLHMVHLSQQ